MGRFCNSPNFSMKKHFLTCRDTVIFFLTRMLAHFKLISALLQFLLKFQKSFLYNRIFQVIHFNLFHFYTHPQFFDPIILDHNPHELFINNFNSSQYHLQLIIKHINYQDLRVYIKSTIHK
jgi:hypothetical protein